MKKSILEQSIKEVVTITSERSAEYSDGYLRHVAVLDALFPNEIPSGPEYPLRVKVRFFFVFHIVGKLVRFCDNIYKEEGHPDSKLDLAGYAVLLNGADREGGTDK